MEAGRPDSITREKLEVLKKHGVGRISINPQTMKQDTLCLIGRRHTVEDVVDRFKLAREVGFDNINMDLIIGLPEETLEDVQATMEAVKALAPDSVTVHSLAIKRAARLNTMKEVYKDLKIENTQEMIDLTARYAREMGLEPYYLYRQKIWQAILRTWAMRHLERPASITCSSWRNSRPSSAAEQEPPPSVCSPRRTASNAVRM